MISSSFALFENMVVLVQSISNVTISWAIIRGLSTALMHAICTVMIGYGMSEDDLEDEDPAFIEMVKKSYCLWRFMIDKRYQGKGYGKKAMQLALDYIRTFPCGKADTCWLSYEPENEVAKKLYTSFGFIEQPQFYKGKEGEEMPAFLKL